MISLLLPLGSVYTVIKLINLHNEWSVNIPPDPSIHPSKIFYAFFRDFSDDYLRGFNTHFTSLSILDLQAKDCKGFSVEYAKAWN